MNTCFFQNNNWSVELPLYGVKALLRHILGKEIHKFLAVVVIYNALQIAQSLHDLLHVAGACKFGLL